MDTTMDTHIDTTSEEAPPPTPEKTSRKKRTEDDVRKYNREYYHEHKIACTCEHCGISFTCSSSLRKHQGRSSKCMVKKLQKYIEDLEDKHIYS